MEIEADESFKKAGAIPFKWEIRPGVPKLQHSHQPISPLSKVVEPQEVTEKNQSRPIPETQRKLRPPPAASFNFQSPNVEPRTRSFRSVPRARSDRYVQKLLTRPVMGVSSEGCFPSPLLRGATEKKKKSKKSTGPEPEPDYMSDLETVSRWSGSTRKSVSPFHDSFSSHESSPRRPVNDADWPGFALF
ncbi:putative pentatricopeptide repeat-containing protein [Capsicum annuum]|uniref:Uncharacterized protein n=1 Tax=Capsicum annuum TaxID=4072 RepID=A0A1U8F6C8_CAPAN|nr:uncharacterized protein LOC107854379 [Capsicum annuum]KAF3614586.1 putative pentatricopeptide repeat-containing protein [Capsicum annuum]KAF3615083.1 putative pentatricopeptide repeat-containing protein [Capsicum annuum]PHT83839.1 hypothetical protein T459_12282 [Capsicum annuum]